MGTFGTHGYAYQKWYYQFIKNVRVYLQAKNQLHSPCFSEDWLSVFWSITWEPEFSQRWDLWWNIKNNINFNFRLFSRKTNEHFSKKFKKYFFRFNLGPFCSNLVKNELPWKREVCSEKRDLFKYSNCLPSCQKSEKPNEPFLRELQNWWMDRKTGKQTYNSDFIGTSATYKWLNHKTNIQMRRWPFTRKQFS